MTKIHALHHQTGELLGTLDNLGDRIYWGDNYIRDLNGEHSFEFQMPSTIKESAFFYGRSRFLIERDFGDYEEFLVYLSETDGQVKYIRAVASYSDMDRDFLIGPGKYSGTMKELSALVLYPNGSYRQRISEYGNIRTIVLDKPIGAYEFLCRLMNLFDMEMDFFVKVTGNSVEGRYVDILKRLGEDRGKLVEIGKDLISLSVKENSENIFTALMCIGPERDDGSFLQKTIFDKEAFQRWNFEGKHRFGVYFPQSEDADMTLEELEEYGRTELNKRIASVYEYDIEVASIGSSMYFGDRIRIKDPSFNPPFYADSRVIRFEKSPSSKVVRTVRLGEVATFTQDEIMTTFRSLQKLYGTRVIKAPTPPTGNPKVIWIKTEEGSDFEVAHTWNGSEWIPITPTKPEDVGAEPAIPEGPNPPSNPKPGAKWVDTSSTPVTLKIWDGQEWTAVKGEPGEDAWKVEVISSNGNIFKANNISTTLEARVYKGGEDVTESISLSKFKWTRVSEDPQGDAVWNDRYFGGTKTIVVTTEDVYRRATFFCEIIE